MQWSQNAFEHLQQILLKDSQSHPDHMVFIDLDSTLFDVSPRNQFIIRDYARTVTDQNLAESLAKIECSPKEYGYDQGLQRLGISLTKEQKKSIAVFWSTNFFLGKNLRHDRPFPGATEFVSFLKNNNVNFAYLSARIKDKMLEGTIAKLKAEGLPHDEKLIHLKPRQGPDGGFKAHFIKTRSEKRIWLVDNEPVVLNAVHEMCPDTQLVFFDSCHSEKEIATNAALRLIQN